MSNMQVAMVEGFKQPMVLREWDVPTPGAGQILVKTEACGVCHTDIHAASGDWPCSNGWSTATCRRAWCCSFGEPAQE